MPRVRESVAIRVLRGAILTVSLAISCLIAGCNIVAPVAALAAGPAKADARYTPKDVPTVVFIDDRQNLVSPTSLRRAIAEKVSADLMANKVVTTMINPQDAILVASRSDRAGELMDIGAIGRAVGAHQVIYVQMTMYASTPDGFTPMPTAGANVKVLDIETQQRLFPGESMPDGWPLKVSGTPVDPSMYGSRPSRLQIYTDLAGETGDAIAKLFYTHEIRPVGENLR